MPKIREKKSPIHENADANITCDFGDGDISRCRSRLPSSHIVCSIIVGFPCSCCTRSLYPFPYSVVKIRVLHTADRPLYFISFLRLIQYCSIRHIAGREASCVLPCPTPPSHRCICVADTRWPCCTVCGLTCSASLTRCWWPSHLVML